MLKSLTTAPSEAPSSCHNCGHSGTVNVLSQSFRLRNTLGRDVGTQGGKYEFTSPIHVTQSVIHNVKFARSFINASNKIECKHCSTHL